ncbi:MAG TPA: (Fe-S)-binding protein [Anaeromyxobacter sp.]|nr:(Fe-S)-binding protein [Anaeromyxobacter sp.]
MSGAPKTAGAAAPAKAPQYKPDQVEYYRQEDLLKLDYRRLPEKDWMSEPAELRHGNFIYPAKPEKLEYIGFPNARQWSPLDQDWKLPENWKEIVFEGMRERLHKYRSFKLFMDVCVRCGACADKCHFYVGGGDPKNMPVLRAELLRSVYRNDFTTAGKILGKLAGARPLTVDVIKEWFLYFYQCTECRRCSVFCPFGIDTAEITMMARELLNLLGVNVNWIIQPVADCYRTGNHLGIQPHGLKDTLEFFAEDIEEVTGVKIEVPMNKKGAEVLFVTPSGDFLADPGIYTCMGYMALFHEIGLDYTFSTYASEGGNFGFFTSADMMKRLNAKIYAEAKRLGVKFIIGGECGHMWRVLHQYMDTMNGPADFLEVPVSPVTGTRFEHARSTKAVHVVEFTADLIRNGKLKLDPSRNDSRRVTFHDSCNTSRGAGILEEPRYVLRSVVNNFFEMPENTIREQTFCCGGGAGLGTEENMEVRLRGGLPRGHAVRHVRDRYGVNELAAMCAIDRATLSTVCSYWAPGVKVTGITELVGNALVMKGEKERELNFRKEPMRPVPEPEPSSSAAGVPRGAAAAVEAPHA